MLISCPSTFRDILLRWHLVEVGHKGSRVKKRSLGVTGSHTYNPIRNFKRDSWRDFLARSLVNCLAESLAKSLADTLAETLGETFGETFHAKKFRRESRIGLYARLSSRLIFLRGLTVEQFPFLVVNVICTVFVLLAFMRHFSSHVWISESWVWRILDAISGSWCATLLTKNFFWFSPEKRWYLNLFLFSFVNECKIKHLLHSAKK